jgi:hypothetical protein
MPLDQPPKLDFTKAWEGVKFTPTVDFEKKIAGVEIDAAGKITREFIRTKEKAIRQALNALGWLSPEEAQALRDELTEAKMEADLN